jgi:hypothetical protein
MEEDGRLSLSKYVSGAFVPVYSQGSPSPPPAAVWARVTTRIVGSRMQAMINGSQVAPEAGWTDMQGGSASGSIWLRSFTVPSAEAWWIDDIRLRRLVDPEPSVALGGEQPL